MDNEILTSQFLEADEELLTLCDSVGNASGWEVGNERVVTEQNSRLHSLKDDL